ncbi:hypothetical protein tinsulaeT_00590 [Thalassotalea insulae]|uniref:Lipoprotein n=1 Tax=Thalassotalea insulae TaxID=2056778 RepID=A0ABQ6GNH0_9GAMM|nr:hypothetical protein tinsulaeT_00590 [Thalassotalea insulae]
MRSSLITIIIVFLLSGCYDTKSINKYYDTCISLKKPVTLNDLESLFGKVHRIDRVNDEVSLHLFSPHADYVMLHSSFIQAEVNIKNQVVGLKCAEDKRVF